MKKDASREMKRAKSERQELQQQKLDIESMLASSRKRIREQREEIAEEEKDLDKKRAQYMEERRSWNKTKFQDAAISDDIEREWQAIREEKARLRKAGEIKYQKV